MIVPTLIFVLVLTGMVWVTFRGRDMWPFSHYPMFSRMMHLSDVIVYRLALKNHDNKINWWTSSFFRYPEFVGKKLGQLMEAKPSGVQTTFVALERNRILAEVLRLILIEEGEVDSYQAFHIVRRTAKWDELGLTLEDKTVLEIPIDEIKRIHLED